MDSLLSQYWLTAALLMMITILFVSVYSSTTATNKSFRKRKIKVVAPQPPKAASGWPIIGHLLMFGSSDQPPHVALGSMADTYGSAFSIQLGSHKTIVVSSSDLVKECFTTNDKVVSYRATPKTIKHMFYDQHSLSSAPYGSYWREVRKLSTIHLLSNHRVEMLSHIRNLEVDAWFNHLYGQYWNIKTTSTAAVLVELDSWFSDMIFDVLVTMIFGKDKYNDDVLSTNDHHDEAATAEEATIVPGKKKMKKLAGEDSIFVKTYKKIGDESMRLMATFAVSDVIPFLGWLDHLRGLDKAMIQNAKEMDSLLGSWIAKRRQSHEVIKEVEDKKQASSAFIDHVLSSMEHSDQTSQFIDLNTETVIKSLCQDLIVGGYDTISVSMTWVICLLLNNRHVLKKAQEELDTNVGKERQVEESDIGKLVYLQAIIKEVMRLYPSGPLLERIAMEDCEIGGFHVGAGERVLVNIWKVQRDPNVWSVPLEFRPERFLGVGEATDKDLRGQHFEFIPFGSGRRICPAITFSVALMNLVLARLIHSFELRTPMDAMVDMTGTPALINKKATPLQVLLTPRLNSRVYKC